MKSSKKCPNGRIHTDLQIGREDPDERPLLLNNTPRASPNQQEDLSEVKERHAQEKLDRAYSTYRYPVLLLGNQTR